MKVIGQTWQFENKPVIIGTGTIVGPEEGEGPLADDFDYIYDNIEINEKHGKRRNGNCWRMLQEKRLRRRASRKTSCSFVGGDLMNQIISSSFAARQLGVPYIGVFGACSTSMESLAVASMLVDSGGAKYVMAGTASHNCTVEKQFRYPTEYGSQKPPYAQYTITGAGCSVISTRETVLLSRMPPSARWWIWASGSVQYGGGDGSGGSRYDNKAF